jgi:hypothetical protein
MKFVISFFICLNSWAGPIRIFHGPESLHAAAIRAELISAYQIPEELISMVATDMCEETQTSGKLDLCIKNNGDLLLVSVDSGFIQSLKIFNAPTGAL